MITILAFFLSLNSIVTHTTDCDTYGPRLNGSFVKVCNGSVKSVTDVNGMTREIGKY
jgi:hypothetical protein